MVSRSKRASQRLTEVGQPLHLGRARTRLPRVGLGCRRLRPGFLTLALLMEHEDDRQDDQGRHEREARAVLDLARQIHEIANRLRGDDDEGDGQADEQRPILPPDDFHWDFTTVAQQTRRKWKDIGPCVRSPAIARRCLA